MNTENPYLPRFQYLVPSIWTAGRHSSVTFPFFRFLTDLLGYLDLCHPAKTAANSSKLTNTEEINDLSSLEGQMLHFQSVKHRSFLHSLLYKIIKGNSSITS